MIKVIAAFGRGCTASACLLVNKKKQFEGDNGGGRGSGAIPYTTYWSLAAILTTLVQSPVNYIMLLSIYKPCVAIAYICRTQWWQYIDVDCFLLEAEMTLAQYRIIYTDYLEFATNPAQRLMMVAHHLLLVHTELKLVMYWINLTNCTSVGVIYLYADCPIVYVLCQAGGVCLTTLSSWNLLQTPWLPAETHIRIVYPPCGHPQTLSHDVTTSTTWSHALRVSYSVYLR